MRSLITTDGVTIAYWLYGPIEGPVVVLCHGICASGRQFAADARRFAALGYRVIVPDLRAHGASGAPSLDGGDFSIARLAADMQAVLDDAGAAQVHWLGNSLGGIVGLGLLSKEPSRFSSFATFGTAYSLNLPRVAPPIMPLVYRLIGPQRLGQVTAALTTSDPRARELIAAGIAAFDPGPGERIADAVRAYNLVAAARQFGGPILVIRGGKDRAVNLALGHTFAAMAGHPGFERIDLQNAGHCANLDVPDEMCRVLDDFWRRAGAEPVADSDHGSADSRRLSAT